LEKYVKVGDTIKVHFTGKFEDGKVFDSSENRDPLKFKVGSGKVIQGFDEAVVGMRPGQEKRIHISSDKAYGPIAKELKITVSKDKLPKNLEFELNQQYQIPNEDGETFLVRVTKISENDVELDGNHPLAGKNLIFNITLMEIEN
jgi:peptidylprolyl isomerase